MFFINSRKPNKRGLEPGTAPIDLAWLATIQQYLLALGVPQDLAIELLEAVAKERSEKLPYGAVGFHLEHWRRRVLQRGALQLNQEEPFAISQLYDEVGSIIDSIYAGRSEYRKQLMDRAIGKASVD